MSKKKVLILHAPFGMGHPMVAKSIYEALNDKYPDIEARNISIFEFAPYAFGKAVPKFYDEISAKLPKLYKWAYDFYDKPEHQKVLNYSSKFFIKSKFTNFINSFNPNFILSTHPLPMQLVSLTKEQNIIDILSANVCTDYGCHSFWVNQDVNYYFVASSEVKKYLLGYGVNQNKIFDTGIPVGRKFLQNTPVQPIVDSLGFTNKHPIYLIVGGQLSCNNIVKIIKEVKLKNSQIQFIVVAGRDKCLYEKLKKLNIAQTKGFKIFGFVENLHEYMSVADLILSKAGGSTVSECLVRGLPMIIYKVIPGQEEDNVSYLGRFGAAVHLEDIEEIAKKMVELSLAPARLEEMRKAAKKLGRPNAACQIADFIKKVVDE